MRQIGYGSNKKTRHLMPSGHKAFVVNNGTQRRLFTAIRAAH